MGVIHIPYEQRIAFAAGELDEAARAAVAAHIAACAECAGTVMRFSAARDILRGDYGEEPPPATIARAQAIFTRVRRPTPKPAARPMLPWVNLFRSVQPRHLSRAAEMALVALIAILLVVGTGAAAGASQDAIPGDTLYPVKITVEGLQIALAPGAASQVELYLAFTQTRVREIVALVDKNRYGKISETATTLERQTQQSALALDIVERQDPDRVGALARRVEAVLSDNESALVALVAVVPPEVRSAIEHAAKFCGDVKTAVIDKFQNGSLVEPKIATPTKTLEPTQSPPRLIGTPSPPPTPPGLSGTPGLPEPTPGPNATLGPPPPPPAPSATRIPPQPTPVPNATPVPGHTPPGQEKTPGAPHTPPGQEKTPGALNAPPGQEKQGK